MSRDQGVDQTGPHGPRITHDLDKKSGSPVASRAAASCYTERPRGSRVSLVMLAPDCMGFKHTGRSTENQAAPPHRTDLLGSRGQAARRFNLSSPTLLTGEWQDNQTAGYAPLSFRPAVDLLAAGHCFEFCGLHRVPKDGHQLQPGGSYRAPFFASGAYFGNMAELADAVPAERQARSREMPRMLGGALGGACRFESCCSLTPTHDRPRRFTADFVEEESRIFAVSSCSPLSPIPSAPVYNRTSARTPGKSKKAVPARCIPLS